MDVTVKQAPPGQAVRPQGQAQGPEDHCPPGYEFAFQVCEDVSEEEARLQCCNVLLESEGLVLVAGHYEHGFIGADSVVCFYEHGWMAFRPYAKHRHGFLGKTKLGALVGLKLLPSSVLLSKGGR